MFITNIRLSKTQPQNGLLALWEQAQTYTLHSKPRASSHQTQADIINDRFVIWESITLSCFIIKMCREQSLGCLLRGCVQLWQTWGGGGAWGLLGSQAGSPCGSLLGFRRETCVALILEVVELLCGHRRFGNADHAERWAALGNEIDLVPIWA